MTIQEIEALITTINGVIDEQEEYISNLKKEAAFNEKTFASVSSSYATAYDAYKADNKKREKYETYATLYQELVDIKAQHDTCAKRVERSAKIIKLNKKSLKKLERILKAAKAGEEPETDDDDNNNDTEVEA